jgi:hypothetical protein
MSADSRYVAFVACGNLIAGERHERQTTFLWDRNTGLLALCHACLTTTAGNSYPIPW